MTRSRQTNKNAGARTTQGLAGVGNVLGRARRISRTLPQLWRTKLPWRAGSELLGGTEKFDLPVCAIHCLAQAYGTETGIYAREALADVTQAL